VTLLVEVFPCRSDNYGYLAHDPETGTTAAIDAPDAGAIRKALAARGWRLTDIFVTHHHADHTDGIAPLKAEFDVLVTGPEDEADRITGLDRGIAPGDTVMLGNVRFHVMGAPGHTLGHVVYHDREGGHLFTGDALFSLGCGRMFEGTPGPMWAGLAAIKKLPDETLIYCGHEYTLANGRFALSVDPDNVALKKRIEDVKALLEAGKYSIPVSLGSEKATNPFLRSDDPGFAASLNLPGDDPVDVFAHLRAAKDIFKG
jgi:hydroxyacylglutathione hydrolase